MVDGVILLVEENPDDEAVTIRALKHKIRNEVDGAVALANLSARETFGRRRADHFPVLVLLNQSPPKGGA